METIGSRLRLAREMLGMHQQQIADVCQRSVPWVRRVESGNGSAAVQDWQLANLAGHFGCSPDWLLGLSDEGGPVKRREFVQRALGIAASAAAVPLGAAGAEPWERIASVLAGHAGVDLRVVDQMEAALTALEGLEFDLPPRALLGPVKGHINEVAAILAQPGPAGMKAALLSNAGEAMATAAWLAWDLDDRRAVEAYFSMAAEAAREAGDRPLEAFIAASSACQPSWREQPAKRLELLQGVGGHATPRTCAWIHSLAAEGHALQGDADACLRELDSAEAILAKLGDDRFNRRPRHDPFDLIRLRGEMGSALAKLGQPARAREPLMQAIRDLPGQPRIRQSLVAALARTYAQEGEPEEAVRLAIESLNAMGPMATTVGNLSRLLDDLRPWQQTPAVQDLEHRIAVARAAA